MPAPSIPLTVPARNGGLQSPIPCHIKDKATLPFYVCIQLGKVQDRCLWRLDRNRSKMQDMCQPETPLPLEASDNSGRAECKGIKSKDPAESYTAPQPTIATSTEEERFPCKSRQGWQF